MNIFEIFRTPTAEQLAQRELDEAKRELLKAQSARDYAEAICAYNTERIGRLSRHIAASGVEA